MDSMIYTPDRLTVPKVSSCFSRRPRFVVCASCLDCRVGEVFIRPNDISSTSPFDFFAILCN